MEILDEKHRGIITKFKSIDDELNEFLNTDAFHYMGLKLGITYLLIDKATGELISYSALSTGAVRIDDEVVFQGLKRKDYPKDLPNQFPALLIGRLATDKTKEGNGGGSLLLKHAIKNALDLTLKLGCTHLAVHSNRRPETVKWYSSRGFICADPNSKKETLTFFFELPTQGGAISEKRPA